MSSLFTISIYIMFMMSSKSCFRITDPISIKFIRWNKFSPIDFHNDFILRQVQIPNTCSLTHHDVTSQPNYFFLLAVNESYLVWKLFKSSLGELNIVFVRCEHKNQLWVHTEGKWRRFNVYFTSFNNETILMRSILFTEQLRGNIC